MSDYDLQFSKAGRFTWHSRNNNYGVTRTAPKTWIVIDGHGKQLGETHKSKQAAMDWANNDQAKKLGLA